MIKRCTVCNVNKDIDNFNLHPTGKYGRNSKCKECMSIKNKKRIVSHEEREKLKEKSRLYRKNNPDDFKWSVKQSSYKKLGINITREEYNKKLKEQDNKCKICGRSADGFKKSLCLDHDHSTLKVRGFLCDNCNAGLGKFKDDILLLRNAIEYLNTPKK